MTKTQYSKITKVVVCVFVSNAAVGMCLVFYNIITRDHSVAGIGLLIAMIGIIAMCASYYMRDKLGKWPHKYYLINYNDGNIVIDLTGESTSAGNAAIKGLEELGYGLVKEDEEKIDGCSFSKHVLQ